MFININRIMLVSLLMVGACRAASIAYIECNSGGIYAGSFTDRTLFSYVSKTGKIRLYEKQGELSLYNVNDRRRPLPEKVQRILYAVDKLGK